MCCFGALVCLIEDMIDILVCLATESVTKCVITLSAVLGTVLYLNRYHGLGVSLGFGVYQINNDGNYNIPTNDNEMIHPGINGPPAIQYTKDGPYPAQRKTPGGDPFISSLIINILIFSIVIIYFIKFYFRDRGLVQTYRRTHAFPIDD